jgi:hypothetical protein
MTAVVMFSLFGSDIKMMAFDKTQDATFDALTTIALLLFIFEIVSVSLVNDGYFLGFYFWLDLVSTASMITDISSVWMQITGTEGDYSANSAE